MFRRRITVDETVSGAAAPLRFSSLDPIRKSRGMMSLFEF